MSASTSTPVLVPEPTPEPTTAPIAAVFVTDLKHAELISGLDAALHSLRVQPAAALPGIIEALNRGGYAGLGEVLAVLSVRIDKHREICRFMSAESRRFF